MTKEIEKFEPSDRAVRLIRRGMKTKSVRDLASDTGLTVEQVIQVRNEALDSVDALTNQQLIEALLVDLMELAEMAREEFLVTSDARSKGPLITAAMGGIKIVLDQVRKIAADSDGEVTALNSLRMRELGLLVETAWIRTLGELADEHEWSTEQRQSATDTFSRNMQTAAQEMDQRNE